MQKKYFIAGPKLLAWNAKCCSSGLVREVIRTYYPEIEAMIVSASYPEGKSADNSQHHRHVPCRINPDRPVVVVVRDPVERFRSAMAQLGLTDVDAVLHELASEEGDIGAGVLGQRLAGNVHFLPQTRFSGDVTYYRMDQLSDAAADLGIATPAHLNEADPGTKPDLTPEQEVAVRAWYAEDVALWESLA